MQRKKWCKSEIIMLIAVYPYISNRILAERFGTTIDGIERKAMRLGIKKDEEYMKQAYNKQKNRTKPRKEICYVHGVKMIYAPDHRKANKKNGYRVSEHVLVMEKHLGRYLEDDERIFHKNGDKENNSLNNLYLKKENTIKKLNIDEIVEKRKLGVTTRQLMREYNISSGTLYKILRKKQCVREKTYLDVIKKMINQMLNLWSSENTNYSFNKNALLYYKDTIKKENKITKEEFEDLITEVLIQRKIKVEDLT